MSGIPVKNAAFSGWSRWCYVSALAPFFLGLLASGSVRADSTAPAGADAAGRSLNAASGASTTAAVASTTTAAAGSTTTAMSPAEAAAAVKLPEYQVTGHSISQAAAFNTMLNSLNLVRVLSQEQIDQTPARTVAQAVQQIPGVSVQHDSDEPRFIQIRGSDQDQNVVTFDGVAIPGAYPGERAVPVDAIPSGMVGNMEVFDTLMPDMGAEGIGGQLNLVPKSAFTYPDGLLDINLDAGYVPERAVGTEYGNVTWAGTYGLGGRSKLGVLVTALVDDKRFGIDDLESSYTDAAPSPENSISSYNFRDYDYQRFRAGGGVSLDYMLDPNDTFYLHAMDGGYDEYRNPVLETNYNDLDFVPPSGPGNSQNTDGSFTITEDGKNGDISTTRTYSLEQDIMSAVDVGGVNKMGLFTLDYKADYSFSTQNTPFGYGWSFKSLPGAITGTVTYNNSTNNGNNPTFDTNNLVGENNASNFAFDKVDNGISDSTVNGGAVQANGKLETPMDGMDGWLKFGLSATDRYANYWAADYEADATGTPLLLSQIQGPNFAFYPGGAYNTGIYSTGPTINGTISQLDGQSPYMTPWYEGDPVGDKGQDWDSLESMYAGYVMYTLKADAWSAEAGVRVEGTDIHYDWWEATPIVDGVLGNELSAPVAEHGSFDYVNFLPNAGIKYDFSPEMTTRLWYSQSMYRPDYAEYIPSPSIGFNLTSGADSVVSATYGNPNLKPTLSNNVDYSWQYDPMKDAMLGVGLFYKGVYDEIKEDYSLIDGSNGQMNLASYSNMPWSRILGGELQYQQQYTMLPKPLNGLGLRGSIDRIDSSGVTTPGKPATQLPSQPNLVWDAGVFYKGYGFTFDVGGAYSSPQIQDIGDLNRDVPDIWFDSFFQIDAKLSYALNKHVSIFADGNNLNNADLRYYEGTSNRPIQNEYYGPTGDTGVNITF